MVLNHIDARFNDLYFVEEEHKMEINQRKTEVEEKEKRQGVIEELKNDIRVKELEFEDQVFS